MFVREKPRGTVPQPDVAAYARFPSEPPETYRGPNPVLVVEVVTPDSREKDYRRNVGLYQALPDILEYWIVDPIRDAKRPSLTVHRRERGDQPFERLDVEPGGVYEPRRWRGLRLDLSRIALE